MTKERAADWLGPASPRRECHGWLEVGDAADADGLAAGVDADGAGLRSAETVGVGVRPG